MIPFNKPHLTGKEAHYIYEAVYSGKISGNGIFTKKCQAFFEETYGFRKCLMTTSCTDALEMAALLMNIEPGDEVIVPSYTFVSTANAFILRGASIVFADSCAEHPGIDEAQLEALITDKTKAIVVVHYAGVACNMDAIMSLANKHNIFVVEDAAQAVDSYYTNKEGRLRPLGSIGHFAAFSFHETKNIISGEGGMLVVNEPEFVKRAEIIWEKGTNRSAFFRGEVNKYGWMDIGSSFLPSEVISAFLYAQIEHIKDIQNRRKEIWQRYWTALSAWAGENNIRLPFTPGYASNNAHMFYIVCESIEQRTAIIQHLKKADILAVFHYLSLHKSPYFTDKHDGRELPNSDYFMDRLLRLPFFYDLKDEEQERVIQELKKATASS